MEGQQTKPHLDQSVLALQNCISTFLDYLSVERDVLLNGDIDRLPEITENKQHTLQELNKLENQIRPHLGILQDSSSLPASEQNLVDSIEWTREKWKHIIETLSECQRINMENGALVNTLLKGTKNALHQLHSLSQSSSTALYNEQGNQHYYSNSKRSVQV